MLWSKTVTLKIMKSTFRRANFTFECIRKTPRFMKQTQPGMNFTHESVKIMKSSIHFTHDCEKFMHRRTKITLRFMKFTHACVNEIHFILCVRGVFACKPLGGSPTFDRETGKARKPATIKTTAPHPLIRRLGTGCAAF